MHNPLTRNGILAALPTREFVRLAERAEIVQLRTRDEVYRPEGPIKSVYFPLDSVFSMVATTDGQRVVEVATIGLEGMVGLPLFLGAATSPHASFCQIPGSAARLSGDDLREVLRDDGQLHARLNRYVQATMVQIAQNVVCNSTHPAEQRAARWLLMSQDRVGRPEFSLTQEFLAQMLGVRRPTVSEIAGRLQDRSLISYRRGVMTVADRAGLEAASCACYAVVRAEFDAMAGP
jgi:CRP-like cAMP-binding protein